MKTGLAPQTRGECEPNRRLEASGDPWAPEPGCRKFGDLFERGASAVNFEIGAENRLFGNTRASAEAISFCSSGEGVHTLSRFTLTFGCGEAGGCWAPARLVKPKAMESSGSFRSTQRF